MQDPDSPATDRQKSYAVSLGIKFPATITKRQISDKIDEAVTTTPASEEQKKLAKDLEIEVPTGATKKELGKLLDKEFAARARVALKSNPVLHAGALILYKQTAYYINTIGRRGKSSRYLATLKPFFVEDGRTITVQIASIADAVPLDERDLRRQAKAAAPVHR